MFGKIPTKNEDVANTYYTLWYGNSIEIFNYYYSCEVSLVEIETAIHLLLSNLEDFEKLEFIYAKNSNDYNVYFFYQFISTSKFINTSFTHVTLNHI